MDRKTATDRQWDLRATARLGDTNLVYLWIGEWAFIGFAGQEPFVFEVKGQGRWVVDAKHQRVLKEAVALFFRAAIPAVVRHGSGYGVVDSYKPLPLDDLKSLIAHTLANGGGKVVQRWETEDGVEIVTIERELPRE